MTAAPTFRVGVSGLSEGDRALRKFAALADLRPFWLVLGRSLADEAQRRWPLRRRTGKLRRSLVWRGDRLGRGGIYAATPSRLTFGTEIFYARFAQHGSKKQRATPLIHIDEADIGQRLALWAKSRAAASGLEVE